MALIHKCANQKLQISEKSKKFNRPPLTSTDFGLLLYYNEFP